MVETFPNYPVHYGTSVKTEIKILKADFGDGYTQRAADGLNNIKESWDVEWKNIDKDTAFEIVNFIKARKGYQGFFWTPPGFDVARIWSCKEFGGPTPVPGSFLYDVRATFIEEFDL